jgi:hypothetical protein
MKMSEEIEAETTKDPIDTPIMAKLQQFIDDHMEHGVTLKKTDRENGIVTIKHAKFGDIAVDVNSGEITTKIKDDAAIMVKLHEVLEGPAPAPKQSPQKSQSVRGHLVSTPSPPLKQPSLNGFRPAKRSKRKLKLAITGPSGAGKTASALLIANGLTNDWNRIGLVDTESGSGDLYTGETIGDVAVGSYNVLTLDPPFTPQRYMEAIKLAENAGLEVLIIDSLSHAWEGEGGVLEMHDAETEASKSKNSYFAWKNITPIHRQLIERIKACRIHVIATMRSKTEYVIGEKNQPVKVGTAPIQRVGTDYEFDVVFDLAQSHRAVVSKDRTNIFDSTSFVPIPETGSLLLEWLETET